MGLLIFGLGIVILVHDTSCSAKKFYGPVTQGCEQACWRSPVLALGYVMSPLQGRKPEDQPVTIRQIHTRNCV